MDREAWHAVVHGVAKSWTRLSDWTELNWTEIALQYCIDFCHTLTWISHRYTYVPSLFNLSPTPSHLSRFSQSTSLSSLRHAAYSHWLSILQMVIYMFSCYSGHSSHSLLPSLCPKICFLCLCLHSALQIGSSVPSFQISYICINIWYFSLSDLLKVKSFLKADLLLSGKFVPLTHLVSWGNQCSTLLHPQILSLDILNWISFF